jgi:GTP cyclohydrolase FolE2
VAVAVADMRLAHHLPLVLVELAAAVREVLMVLVRQVRSTLVEVEVEVLLILHPHNMLAVLVVRVS